MDAQFDEVHTLITGAAVSTIILPIAYFIIRAIGFEVNALLYNALMSFALLFFIRNNFIRVPTYIMGILTYAVYYPYIANSGGIYSPMAGFLYLYLVGAYWGDRNSGAMATALNILILVLLYINTPEKADLSGIIINPVTTLIIHVIGTSLLGALLWIVQVRQDKAREEIKQLQNQRIEHLDLEVTKRTEQLRNVRQSLATDFHDETGNLLSAITMQASMLKLRLRDDDDSMPMVNSIIKNSNELYASSKHFLWNLNHNSQDPSELFEYLTGFGQAFYNQFDISFSAKNNCQEPFSIDQFISLSLIFIFKEAMNNVVKHSGATEVELEMSCPDNALKFTLVDNGTWKTQEAGTSHYGLENMKKRSEKYNLILNISSDDTGTKVSLTVPVNVQTGN